MTIRQDAEVKAAYLNQGQQLDVQATRQLNYIHVISGQVRMGDQLVNAGDALLFAEDCQIEAQQDSQMIWFDLPQA